jgi:hypothetical protein
MMTSAAVARSFTRAGLNLTRQAKSQRERRNAGGGTRTNRTLGTITSPTVSTIMARIAAAW